MNPHIDALHLARKAATEGSMRLAIAINQALAKRSRGPARDNYTRAADQLKMQRRRR